MKKVFIILICSFSFHFAFAQLDFSFYQEEYAELENGQLLTFELWDDPEFYIPLGFNFELFDNVITGLTTYGGYHNELFLESEFMEDSSKHVLVPFMADLMDPGFLSGISEGNISYETIGNSPYQICKIQWKNCGFYNEYDLLGTIDDRINFQVWLFEGSNSIEYHYGEMEISHSDIIFENYSGVYIGILEGFDILNESFDNEYHVTNTVSYPDIENSFSMLIEIYLAEQLAIPPLSDQVFRFSPQTATEVNNIIQNKNIQVFPTVFEENLTISSDKKIQYYIYGMNGRKILEGERNAGDHIINLAPITSGSYLLEVLDNTGKKTFKLVKK